MSTTNPLDPSDTIALGPNGPITVLRSTTEYNEKGLPSPPGGWGKKLGTEPKLAPDSCEA